MNVAADEPQPITQMLHAASEGDAQAAEQLLPLVYDELRRLARARMASLQAGQTLEPTALVHEAYLNVVGKEDPGFAGRSHFFSAAARAMRNILVDQYRRRMSLKRGGDRKRVPIEGVDVPVATPAADLIAIDEVLHSLEMEDPRKAEVVNLRYFVGLTNEETAATLGVSIKTIEREWRYIRAWLKRRLKD